jgi:hypothetical protein
MTVSNIAIGVCLTIWGALFVAPLVAPAVQLDPTVNLVLMALAGGLMVLRQRNEEAR